MKLKKSHGIIKRSKNQNYIKQRANRRKLRNKLEMDESSPQGIAGPQYVQPDVSLNLFWENYETPPDFFIEEGKLQVVSYDLNLLSSNEVDEDQNGSLVPLKMLPIKSENNLYIKTDNLPSNLETCLTKLTQKEDEEKQVQELNLTLQKTIEESIQDLIQYNQDSKEKISVHRLKLKDNLIIPMEDPMQSFELVMLEKLSYDDKMNTQMLYTSDDNIEGFEIILTEELLLDDQAQQAEFIQGIIMQPQCNMNDFQFITGFGEQDLNIDNKDLIKRGFKKSQSKKKAEINRIKELKNNIFQIHKKLAKILI